MEPDDEERRTVDSVATNEEKQRVRNSTDGESAGEEKSSRIHGQTVNRVSWMNTEIFIFREITQLVGRRDQVLVTANCEVQSAENFRMTNCHGLVANFDGGICFGE